MDANRKAGTKRQVKGALKEMVGKLTGNRSKRIAGNVEKNLGKMQKLVGKASDSVRNAVHKGK